VSKDTWGGDYNQPLSLNSWNYVEANPIIYVDPSGYWRWWLSDSKYHMRIEDYYESMFGFNPDKQLEYPIPGTPHRHLDMFNSLIGDIYEMSQFILFKVELFN
jgi:hypothetical protein